MEPDVSNYSCHGFEKHTGLQVAQNARAHLGRILVFQVTYQASVRSLAIGSRDLSTKQINGYQDLGVANLLDI
jgi:hypothetical protein